eukprot:TRINITY_DN100465_c0_g1_i1.p3 TRINITY_DN100465_c0_g1~~TRINITY_DN100465_c0_g1_i1.p3  ORF type:complete len:102 (-),score=19.28 TRINITY_DN100465_c0_g1_i1:60-365(-)
MGLRQVQQDEEAIRRKRHQVHRVEHLGVAEALGLRPVNERPDRHLMEQIAAPGGGVAEFGGVRQFPDIIQEAHIRLEGHRRQQGRQGGDERDVAQAEGDAE